MCIFERAVADNCLRPELWIRYVNYVVCICMFCCIFQLFLAISLVTLFFLIISKMLYDYLHPLYVTFNAKRSYV